MYDNAQELRDQQTMVLDDHDHMSNTSEDRQAIITRSKTSCQYDWLLLAVAIDRITFLIYCLIFTILAIVYAVWFSESQFHKKGEMSKLWNTEYGFLFGARLQNWENQLLASLCLSVSPSA